MVLDRLENAEQYYGLGEYIEKTLKFFQSYDVAEHTPGKITIDGDNLFMYALAYDTNNENLKYEGHKKYIDIMCVFEGEERLWHLPSDAAKDQMTEYNAESDCWFTEGAKPACEFKLCPGSFCILFPQDLHSPGKIWEETSAVKKLVAKVIY